MKSRYFKLLSCLGLVASFCMQSATAEAIYASVKATGMAATCVAYPLDSLVVAYNPAGITDVGDRIDLEAGWVRSKGSTTNVGNQSPVAPLVNGRFNGMRTNNAYVGGGGAVKQLCLGGYDVAVGFAVYNRDYQKTTYKRPLVLFGTSNPGLEYVHEVASLTAAVKICDSWNFGVSANYHIERLKVNGLQNFDNALFSVNPGHVTNRGYCYSNGWSGSFGFRGQLTDDLSVGVSYTTKASMNKMTKYSGFLAGGRIDVPQKVNAGIAYQALPCVVVAFDYEWYNWKGVRSIKNPLLQNGVLNQLGSNNGPGFGFRDVHYYRFGIDWKAMEDLNLRLGYRYAKTPTRATQTAVNSLLLDCVEHFITCGATYELNCAHELSILFAYGFEKKVKGQDSIPLAFGGGNANLKEQKYALGLAWGWKY